MPDVISHWEKKNFMVPFLTNFIFMDCFEVGTVDLISLMKDLILVMIILKTLS